ncbi:hypothetical protein ACFQZ4_14805 [Catellatospora coxensis]
MDRYATRRNITIAAVVAVLLVAVMALLGYCARTAMAPSGEGGAPAASAVRTPVSGLPTVPCATCRRRPSPRSR